MSLHIGYRNGTREPYSIEPEHLRTHAMCVGMTGSGKTGLCIALLEELALQQVPMVLIDPKGDLANIMLCPRTPAHMKALLRAEDAAALGMTHDAYAEKLFAEWSAAREQDGATEAKLDRFGKTWFRIYTPGGGPGLGLSIVSALKQPKGWEEQAATQRAEIVAESILSMCPRAQQTQHARSLIAHLMLYAWRDGQDSSLPALVDGIIDPPMAHLGGLDVETYFPRSKRMRLAQELNGIMSSPAWESWLVGDALDFGSLLYDPDMHPTVTVINIAHLGDQQRQFFVALLLNQAVQWMREQPGTANLKALLYMDEVAGYFPPSGNTPAKRAALTLIKQGRAFGLGCMFASQNPVDLDYKLLGNMGLWMIGKLNTARDKARLEDGLEGEVKVPDLGKREFLVRNIHTGGDAQVVRSRCTMSYLFGPIASEMIEAMAGADPGGATKRELYRQRCERMQVAIDKQAQVVDALQKEVIYAVGGNFLTVLVSMFMGRRATAMRQMTRKPPKKAQQLLEARARLQAMNEEYRSVYELWQKEAEQHAVL